MKFNVKPFQGASRSLTPTKHVLTLADPMFCLTNSMFYLSDQDVRDLRSALPDVDPPVDTRTEYAIVALFKEESEGQIVGALGESTTMETLAHDWAYHAEVNPDDIFALVERTITTTDWRTA